MKNIYFFVILLLSSGFAFGQDCTLTIDGPETGVVCAGVETEFIVMETTDATYTWSLTLEDGSVLTDSPALTFSEDNPSVIVFLTVTGEHELEVSVTVGDDTSTGCRTITVESLTDAAVGFADTSGLIDNDGVVCLNDSVSLVATGSGQNYEWSVSDDDTSMVTIPGLTTGNMDFSVTITDLNGCKDTITSFTTVNGLPDVTTEVREMNGGVIGDVVGDIICEGEEVVITASSSDNGASFSWDTGDTGPTITPENLSTAVPNSFTVTATDANNCKADADVEITVLEAPTATITVREGGDVLEEADEVCVGTNINLEGPAGLDYLWSTGEITQDIDAEILSTANNSFALTVTAGGCTDSIRRNIVVNARPVVTLSVEETSATPGDDQVCLGDGVTLIATPGGLSSYEWSDGNEMGSSVSRVISVVGNQAFSVVATNAKDCVSEPAPATVRGLDLPGASISAVEMSTTSNGSDFSVCTDESITLKAMGQGTYLWDNGDDTDMISPPTNIAGTIEYSVTVTGANRCTSVDSVDVTVSAKPTAGLIVDESSGVSTEDDRVCLNDFVELSATGEGTYEWSDGNETSARITRRISSLDANSFSVTVRNPEGCEASASIDVTGLALPVPEIQYEETSTTDDGDRTICEEERIVLTASGGTTFEWNGERINPLIVENREDGNYQFVLTVENDDGCSAFLNTNVQVLPLPDINLSVRENSGIDNDDNICPGTEVELSVSGLADLYVWSTDERGDMISVVPDTNGRNRYSVTALLQGCKQTIQEEINLYIPPVATAQRASGILVVAQEQNFSSMQSREGDGEITSWVWNFGAVDDARPSTSLLANQSGVTYDRVGRKTVTLDLTDANGCTSSDNVNFDINLNQACQISSGATDRDACLGTQFDIELTPFSNGTEFTWNWVVPAGLEIISQDGGDITLEGNVAGQFDISVSFTDNLPTPCSSPVETITVNIVTPPDPVLTLDDINLPNCPDGQTVLRVNNPGEAYSFEMILNNGQTFVVNDGSIINVNLQRFPGLQSIRAVLARIVGNGDNPTCESSGPFESVTIEVEESPDVTFGGDIISPCPGGQLILNIVDPENNFNIFNWILPNGDTIETSEDTLTVIGLDGVYSVFAETVRGCVSTGSINVILAVRPDEPIIEGPEVICNGQFNVEYNTVADPSAKLMWEVSDGGVIIDSTGNRATIDWLSIANTETIEVIIEATPSIMGDSCMSPPGTLEVTARDMSSPDTTEVILLSQNQQDYFLIAATPSECYEWGNEDGPIAGETFRSLFLGDVQGGSAAVLLDGYYVDTWNGDCFSNDDCRNRSIFRGRSGEEQSSPYSALAAKVYPNPVTSGTEIILELQSPRERSTVEASIFDLNGRLVSQYTLRINGVGEYRQAIPIKEFASGYYVLKLVDTESGETKHIPLIVNR